MFGDASAQSGGKVTGTDDMELRVVLGGRDLSSRLAEIEETGRRAITEADVRIMATLCAEEALRSRDAELQGLRKHAENHAVELQQVAVGVEQRFAACEKRLDDERTEHRRSLGELALKLHGLEVLASRLADTVAQVLQEPEVRKVVESCVAQALASRHALMEEMREQMSSHSECLKKHATQMEDECMARKQDLADINLKLCSEMDAQTRAKEELARLSDRIGVGIAKNDLLEASVSKASSELASKVSDTADAQAKLKEDIAKAREKLEAVVARNDLLEVSLGKTSTEFRSAHSALESQVSEKTRQLSDDMQRVQGSSAEFEKVAADLRVAVSNNSCVERLADDLVRAEASSAASLKSAIAAEAARREAGFQAAENKVNIAMELATGVKSDVAKLGERFEAGASRSDHLATSLDEVQTELRSARGILETQLTDQCAMLREEVQEGRRSEEPSEYATLSRLAEDLAQSEARAVAAAKSAVAAEAILREEGLRATDAKAITAAAVAAETTSSKTLLAELEAERSTRAEEVARLQELSAAAERRLEDRCEAVEVEAAGKLRQAQEAWAVEARAKDIAMNALSDNLQELEYGLSNHTHDLQFSGHAGPSPAEASSKQSMVPSRPSGPAPMPAGAGASAARTLSSTLSSTPRSQTVPLELYSR